MTAPLSPRTAAKAAALPNPASSLALWGKEIIWGVIPCRRDAVFAYSQRSGRIYIVSVDAGGTPSCNCPAGLRGVCCYHILALITEPAYGSVAAGIADLTRSVGRVDGFTISAPLTTPQETLWPGQCLPAWGGLGVPEEPEGGIDLLPSGELLDEGEAAVLTHYLASQRWNDDGLLTGGERTEAEGLGVWGGWK